MASPYDPQNPGNEFSIAPEQIQALIDSVRITNDNIRLLTQGIEGMVKGHARERQQQLRIPAEGITPEGNVTTNLQDKESAEAQKTMRSVSHTQEASRQKKRYEQMTDPEKIQYMKDIGLMDNKGNVTVNGQKLTQGQIEQAMNAGTQDVLTQLNLAVATQINKVVSDQAPSRIGRILDAAEESGIRQLRFGQLPVQDLLKAVGTLTGKVHEHFYADQTDQFGNVIAPARRGTGGILEKVLGGVSRTFPIVGQAIAVGEQAGRVFQKIYEKSIGNYRSLTHSGQLTGQGTMAGFEAKYLQPLSLMNPFGMIDFKTAQEIVQQTREKGFTGKQATTVEQGMATVISKLGIEVGQASDFFTQSLREGGMSVNDVVTEMKKFHDAAFNLNMNINDYTQQILDNTNALREEGAGKAAPGIAQALTAAVPVGYRGGEGQKFVQEAAGKARGVLAAMVGGGANVLNIFSQRYANRAYHAFDTLMKQQIAFAESSLPANQRSLNDIATRLSETSPYFEGMPVDFIQNYIGQLRGGRGVSAQMNIRRQQELYAQRLSAARGTETLKISSMSDEQLNRLGITRSTVPTASRGGGRPTYTYKDAQGNILSGGAFRKTIGSHYMRDQVEQAKQELIASLGGTLTEKQRSEIMKASPFDVNKVLAQISGQKGPKVKIDTGQGFNIQIQLKPGMEQKLFELNTANNKAVSAGQVPANTLPTPRYPVR